MSFSVSVDVNYILPSNFMFFVFLWVVVNPIGCNFIVPLFCCCFLLQNCCQGRGIQGNRLNLQIGYWGEDMGYFDTLRARYMYVASFYVCLLLSSFFFLCSLSLQNKSNPYTKMSFMSKTLKWWHPEFSHFNFCINKKFVQNVTPYNLWVCILVLTLKIYLK